MAVGGCDAFGEWLGVGEALLGVVAGRAGDRAVGGEAGVEEEALSQQRGMGIVRDGVGRARWGRGEW